MAIIHTTYQLRGYLSKSGYAALDNVLRQCAILYNAGLQEWQDAYSKKVGWQLLRDAATGKPVMKRDGSDLVYVPRRVKRQGAKSPTYYDQLKEFTAVRADDPFWASLDVNVGRGVLQRLERSKKAFFRRVKVGEKPGYPRFKSGFRWKTLEMAMVRPSMVRDGQVRIKGLPPIRIPSERPLPLSADLKTLRITRAGRRVTVSLGYEVEREPLPASEAAVGIDMGITDRMVLASGQVVLAGEDIPAAVLETAEIPTQGVTPGAEESSELSLLIEGQVRVTPGAEESSPALTVPERVTPGAEESSRTFVEGLSDEPVTPGAEESSESSSGPPIRRRVTPGAEESSEAQLLQGVRGMVTPGAEESSGPGQDHHSGRRVTPGAEESSVSWVMESGSWWVTPGAGESSIEFNEESSGEAPSKTAPRRVVDRHGLAKKQRRLSRTRKGSRRFRQRARILANAHSRHRVANRNQCHRITTAIVREYGHIGVEALAIPNMTKSAKGTLEEPGANVAAKAGLNREILAQTWGVIRTQLKYKAEWAGRRFVEVDPRHTSQTCSHCGVVDAASRVGKEFSCRICGIRLDADVNAAINILRKSRTEA